jgi:ankyrin repeat protein
MSRNKKKTPIKTPIKTLTETSTETPIEKLLTKLKSQGSIGIDKTMRGPELAKDINEILQSTELLSVETIADILNYLAKFRFSKSDLAGLNIGEILPRMKEEFLRTTDSNALNLIRIMNDFARLGYEKDEINLGEEFFTRLKDAHILDSRLPLAFHALAFLGYKFKDSGEAVKDFINKIFKPAKTKFSTNAWRFNVIVIHALAKMGMINELMTMRSEINQMIILQADNFSTQTANAILQVHMFCELLNEELLLDSEAQIVTAAKTEQAAKTGPIYHSPYTLHGRVRETLATVSIVLNNTSYNVTNVKEEYPLYQVHGVNVRSVDLRCMVNGIIIFIEVDGPSHYGLNGGLNLQTQQREDINRRCIKRLSRQDTQGSCAIIYLRLDYRQIDKLTTDSALKEYLKNQITELVETEMKLMFSPQITRSDETATQSQIAEYDKTETQSLFTAAETEKSDAAWTSEVSSGDPDLKSAPQTSTPKTMEEIFAILQNAATNSIFKSALNDAVRLSRSVSGDGIIHLAARCSDPKILKKIIFHYPHFNFDDDLNAINLERKSPLHLAVESGNPENVLELLKVFADSEISDLDGNIPADLAINALIKIIIEEGKDNAREENIAGKENCVKIIASLAKYMKTNKKYTKKKLLKDLMHKAIRNYSSGSHDVEERKWSQEEKEQLKKDLESKLAELSDNLKLLDLSRTDARALAELVNKGFINLDSIASQENIIRLFEAEKNFLDLAKQVPDPEAAGSHKNTAILISRAATSLLITFADKNEISAEFNSDLNKHLLERLNLILNSIDVTNRGVKLSSADAIMFDVISGFVKDISSLGVSRQEEVKSQQSQQVNSKKTNKARKAKKRSELETKTSKEKDDKVRSEKIAILSEALIENGLSDALYKLIAANPGDFLGSYKFWLARECAYHGFDNLVEQLIILDQSILKESMDNGYTLLMAAVRSGNLDLVTRLLELECNVNDTYDNVKGQKISSLQLAINGEFIQIARLLIENGAILNVRQAPNEDEDISKNISPIALAVGKNLPEMVEILLEKGLEISEELKDHLMNIVLKKGYVEILASFINHGVIQIDSIWNRPVEESEVQVTSLQLAIASPSHRSTEMAELLIEKGANPNLNPSGNKDYLTIVMAVKNNRHKIVKKLLEKMVEISAELSEELKYHLMNIALEEGYVEILAILINHGVIEIDRIWNHSIKEGEVVQATALQIAISRNSPRCKEMAELLIEKGADVNPSCDKYYSPITLAVRKNLSGIVKKLLEKMVEISEELSEELKHHLMNIALNNVYVESLAILIRDDGIEIDKRPYEVINKAKEVVQLTSLQLAITSKGDRGRSIEMAALLIEKGANVNLNYSLIKDYFPISMAVHKNIPEIVEILLKKMAEISAELSEELKDHLMNIALKKGYVEILASFINHDVIQIDKLYDFSIEDTAVQATALQIAISSNSPRCKEMVELLIEKNANPNLNPSGNKDYSPITLALSGDRHEIVEILLKKMAEISEELSDDLKEHLMLSAIDEHCYKSFAILIKDGGIEIDRIYDCEVLEIDLLSRGTALMIAASKLRSKMVEALIDRGAEIGKEVQQKDGSKITTLGFLLKNDYLEEMAQYLKTKIDEVLKNDSESEKPTDRRIPQSTVHKVAASTVKEDHQEEKKRLS